MDNHSQTNGRVGIKRDASDLNCQVDERLSVPQSQRSASPEFRRAHSTITVQGAERELYVICQTPNLNRPNISKI